MVRARAGPIWPGTHAGPAHQRGQGRAPQSLRGKGGHRDLVFPADSPAAREDALCRGTYTREHEETVLLCVRVRYTLYPEGSLGAPP